jgi:hypothetical protein
MGGTRFSGVEQQSEIYLVYEERASTELLAIVRRLMMNYFDRHLLANETQHT